MRNRLLALALLLLAPSLRGAPPAGRGRESVAAPFAPAAAAVAVSPLVLDRTGLVAHYPFEGSFRDASGRGAVAAPSGGTALGADRWGRSESACDAPRGGALSFPRPVTLGPQVSFAAFLLLRTGDATLRPLLTTTGASKLFQLQYDAGSNQLRVLNGTGTIRTVSVAFPRDRWFHLALVFDGAQATTYLDGASIDLFPYGSDIAAGPTFVLGSLPTDSRYWWNGGFDEVRLYTRALLPEEVAALATETMCAASRTLPTYAVEVPSLVTVRVSVPATAGSWTAEETTPAAFRVTEVSDGGTWDAATGKVRWGPFGDVMPRQLQYVVTPPAGTTGRKVFSGTVTADGRSVATCGDTQMASSEVHPADVTNDMTLSEAEVTPYAASWLSGTTWPVDPNPIPIAYVANGAFLWKSGGAYAYDASVAPPFVPKGGSAPTAKGTAVSAFSPCSYTAGGTVSVTIVVTPPAGTKAWALEDAPPSGWTVTVPAGGPSWDATNRKVKWGPYTDTSARTLGYTARAGAVDSGKRTFSGTVSWDGVNAAVSGSREIDSSGCGASGYEYWAAAVVKATGVASSVWQSDVTLLNTSGTAAANAELRVYGYSGSQAVSKTVAPGTQLVLADLYGQLFTTEGAAPLRVTSDQPLTVTTRTYNSSSAGTFGATYLCLASDQWLKEGDSVYLLGLREDGLFRTNLGFANGGTSDGAVTVTLYDASGAGVTQYVVPIAPKEFLQDQQPFAARGGVNIASGFAKVTVGAGSPILVFASVIDNRTNDPTAVFPQK